LKKDEKAAVFLSTEDTNMSPIQFTYWLRSSTLRLLYCNIFVPSSPAIVCFHSLLLLFVVPGSCGEPCLCSIPLSSLYSHFLHSLIIRICCRSSHLILGRSGRRLQRPVAIKRPVAFIVDQDACPQKADKGEHGAPDGNNKSREGNGEGSGNMLYFEL